MDCEACIRICTTDPDPRRRDKSIKKFETAWAGDYKHITSRCFLSGDSIEVCNGFFQNLNKNKNVADETPAMMAPLGSGEAQL